MQFFSRFSFPRLRLAEWVLVNIALTLLIGVIKPALLPVSLYKLSMVFLAGLGAYWFDRRVFPYARPDAFMDQHFLGEGRPELKFAPADLAVALCFCAAMIRRALIIGAAMIGVALGA